MLFETLSLDFKAGGNGTVLLGEGWSWPQQAGTWTIGQRSELRLPPPRTPGVHTLRLRMIPCILPDRAERQRLTALLNGIEIARQEFTREDEYEVACVLDDGMLRADAENVLVLEHPDAAAPAGVLEGSKDERELGFRLLSLELSEGTPGEEWLSPIRLDFAEDGNAGPYLGEGWSFPHESGTWTLDGESVLVLPPAQRAEPLRVRALMVAHVTDEHPSQRVRMTLNGTKIGEDRLAATKVFEIICDVPAEAVNTSGQNLLAIEHPDAARPPADARALALRLLALEILPRPSPVSRTPIANEKYLFVVSGVCQAGEQPNLELVRFLYSNQTELVLWIDFKQPADYAGLKQRVDKQFPGVHVCLAPPALWGGPSVVRSMLEAFRFCSRAVPNWSRLVFCSNRDVPLVRRQELLACIDSWAEYDYCASRWTRHTADYWLTAESMMVADEIGVEREYLLVPIREGAFFRIDKEVIINSPMPDWSFYIQSVSDGRFRLAVSENFAAPFLSLHRMTRARALDRAAFFARHPLIVGRQWCVCSRRFVDITLGDAAHDIFADWFSDILIADECFFHSVAMAHWQRGTIRVRWENLYHSDGFLKKEIDADMYRQLIASRRRNEVLARKEAGVRDYARFLEDTARAPRRWFPWGRRDASAG